MRVEPAIAHNVIDIGLAVLAGTLCFLACSYFRWAFLAWFALVPLLWVIDRTKSGTRALALAWCAGVVASFGTCDWMVPMLMRFTGAAGWVAALMHLAFSAYQGIVFLLFGVIVRAGRRLRWPMGVIAPPAIVAAQWAIPFLFPYGLEISQGFTPRVIQIADLTGRFGVTALLLLVNGTLYDVIDLSRPAGTQRAPRMVILASVAAAVLLLACALGYSQWRMRSVRAQLAAAPMLRIGVMQPNAAFDTSNSTRANPSAERARELLARLKQMRQMSSDLVRQGAELVVWSETAIPFQFARGRTHDYALDDPRAVTAGVAAPIVAGALTYEPGDRLVYNSALLFDTDGRIEGRHDKEELVPFGEYIPRMVDFPWVREVMLGTGGDLHAGGEAHTIEMGTPLDGRRLRLAVLICSEDVSRGLTRRLGREHPDLMVNLTNDAWFGDSTEPAQHLAMAVYVAVEQRASLVRAVNPGGSAYIDPLGRIVARTHLVDPARTRTRTDGAVASLPLVEGGTTLYDTMGDTFAELCVVLSLAMVTWAYAPARVRRSRAHQP